MARAAFGRTRSTSPAFITRTSLKEIFSNDSTEIGGPEKGEALPTKLTDWSFFSLVGAFCCRYDSLSQART
jgi:hypothetical protein